MNKTLFIALLTLIILILIKSNLTIKNNFYKYVYDTNFPFAQNFNKYTKYLGNIIPVTNTKDVFKETLNYSEKEKYLDGVKLTVSQNYLVPVLKSGLVINSGEKDGYGNCIIIQQIDGVDLSYCNFDVVNVSIYDYVSEGSLLGEVSDFLYLVYKKDGNILNYEEYLP
jgi:murein DD-endopeptidase MepM/ murein hydrolase activator NlpD